MLVEVDDEDDAAPQKAKCLDRMRPAIFEPQFHVG
jgi:hypothetical protein